jgi:benzoyl-CoA reductase subunit C
MAATPNKTDRPRIAWLCSYVPRELILAAGLEPVRLTGRVESIKAAGDRLLHNFCPYLKNVLDSVLRDECQDLAGLILAHSCDGARRLSELLAGRLPFIYFLDLPKNADENGLKYYAARLADLKSRLEEAFDTTVSAADLDRAISVMNDRRRAMLSLFEGQPTGVRLDRGRFPPGRRGRGLSGRRGPDHDPGQPHGPAGPVADGRGRRRGGGRL